MCVIGTGQELTGALFLGRLHIGFGYVCYEKSVDFMLPLVLLGHIWILIRYFTI